MDSDGEHSGECSPYFIAHDLTEERLFKRRLMSETVCYSGLSMVSSLAFARHLVYN